MFKKLLFLLCLLLTLPAVAQKKTFTAACLNVDGLPPTVKAAGVVNVNLNEEGPQEDGTLYMSKLVSQKGWDFFGVSENFNYNDQLMSEISSIYSTGTYRGKIPASVTNVIPYLNGTKWFDTDGLNLLWKSATGIKATDEAWYLWNTRNGITSDGADQLIAKGFRYYTVSVGAGLEMDVYILHMDAETSEKDNLAREDQMKQLVDMILASNNKRPILIMGDTNCRYTRDNMKGLMFDRINEDPRFEIHDPWIDYARKGVMPNLGDPALMKPDKFDGTNHEAFQTAEVVDKVFYINNTDSKTRLTALNYLQDTDYTWPDGSEVSDHFPIVIDFEIENVSGELNAGEYYIRNVGTGEFLAAGANWGTRAVVSRTGNRVKLEQVDGADQQFYIRTTLNSLSDGLWMDASGDYPFTFKPIEGTSYVTISTNGQNALTVDGDKVVQIASSYDGNPVQQWEMLSEKELTDRLISEASETNPFDATYFIKGANFSRNDSDVDSWVITKTTNTCNLKDGLNVDDLVSSNFIGEMYNSKIDSWSTSKSNGTVSQSITGLPNGVYKVSFQGFTRNGNADFYVSFNSTKVGFNDISSGAQSSMLYPGEKNEKDVLVGQDIQSNNAWVPNSMKGAAAYFNKGLYTLETEITLTNNKLDIVINKPHTKSETWMTFDNFVLTYYGPTAEDLATLDRVKVAIDDAQAKADEMGLSSYSNRAVVDLYNNRRITGDGSTEIKNTYIALAKAATKQSAIPADMRYAILNNSFERGDLSYWTNNATNARVEKSDAATDGEYLVKADGGELKYTFEVTLPNGIYELKAHVTPGAVIFADDFESSAVAGTAGQLTEASLKFIVSKGTATVGVRCDGAFTADNFVLTRVGDQNDAGGYEILSLAIKDATERVNQMGSPYSDDWNLSAYQAMLDNLTLEGDGTKEFYEIYELLRAKVYSQPNTDGVSFTNAIINPGFEFGQSLGWDRAYDGDTGVKEIANDTYTMSSADGTYLFNTWDENRGTILKQTIKGLPAGHYRLRATFASDQNNWVYMDANGQKQNFQLSRAKEVGEVLSMEFDVAANTTEVTISVGGCNEDGSYDDFGGTWYKVDKFELTRHGDQKVCFFYDRLQKAIDRANEIAAELPDKYRVQWDASDYRDLYDKHIESDHVADPMEGSNGLAEINELYARLRALIFSQTEAGADMSGAILNQSFELGDLTGWNTVMPPSADTKVVIGNEGGIYGTGGIDGKYLFNTWMNGKANPIWTTTTGVPAGKYRVSAKLASDAGNQFYFVVNGAPSDVITTTGGADFMTVSMEITLTEDASDLTFGIYPTPNGTFFPENEPLSMGPWFKADDFALTLLQAPEVIEYTPMGQYDTIILPFDVDMGDDRYADLDLWEIKSSYEHEFHVQLELATPDPFELKANVPYIVEYRAYVQPDESEQPEQIAAKRAAAAQTNTFIFTGIPTGDLSTYKDDSGMLVGSHSEQTPSAGEFVMNHNSSVGSAFTRVGEEENPVVAAHRAYISLPNANDKITHILLNDEQSDIFTTTGIGAVEISGDTVVDVYNVSGILLRSGVPADEATENLSAGLYILRSGNLTSKIVK